MLAPESRSQRSKNEAYDEEEDIVFFRFLDFCDIMKIALAPPTALKNPWSGIEGLFIYFFFLFFLFFSTFAAISSNKGL